MKTIIRENKGQISFLYGTRRATNEERYEGFMRGSFQGTIKITIEAMVICSSLKKGSVNA